MQMGGSSIDACVTREVTAHRETSVSSQTTWPRSIGSLPGDGLAGGGSPGGLLSAGGADTTMGSSPRPFPAVAVTRAVPVVAPARKVTEALPSCVWTWPALIQPSVTVSLTSVPSLTGDPLARVASICTGVDPLVGRVG